MSSVRTAADVRSYFLKNWRELLPDLLATQARVGPAPQDDTMVHIELGDEVGLIRHLLLVPLASGEPRLLRGLLPHIRELSRTNVWAGLVVPHMGAAGLRVCREAGIGYVDCCANAYLHFNQVVVQIAGNRNRFSVPKRPRTLFNDKATIPLRILLENPEASVTTREIADRGGMSLGWVSQILQQLHTEGYVERKRGGGTRLLHPNRLLEDWLRQYTFEQNKVYPFQMRETGVAETLERLRGLQPPLFDRYALTLDAAGRPRGQLFSDRADLQARGVLRHAPRPGSAAGSGPAALPRPVPLSCGVPPAGPSCGRGSPAVLRGPERLVRFSATGS